jgi:hypothetical protein
VQLNCWIEGLWLDSSLIGDHKIPGEHILKDGVGANNDYDNIDKISLKFYQWIVPMLFLQSFLFYLPNAFWQRCENRTMLFLLGKVCEYLSIFFY